LLFLISEQNERREKMKKQLLRLVILAMIIALVVSIGFIGSGCKNANSSETTVAETTVAETTVAETTVAETTVEPITIKIWSIAGTEIDWWQQIKQLYEAEHPNVTLDITVQDSGALSDLVSSALSSGGQEDVDIIWQAGGGQIDSWARDGLIYNLTPLFEKNSWYDHMYTACRDYATPDLGSFFFNTDWVATPLMFYNKDIFTEAGVQPPTTMDEIFTIAEKIKSAGFDAWALGSKDAMAANHLFNQLLARFLTREEVNEFIMWERDPNKSEETAEIFRSQGVIDTYDFIIEMKNQGVFQEGASAIDDSGAHLLFTDGNAGIYSSGSWCVATIPDANPDINFDYFIMPPNGDKTSLCATFCNGVIVPAYIPENKLAVVEDIFNSILTDKEYALAGLNANVWVASNSTTEEEMSSIIGPMNAGIMADVAANGSIDIVDVWNSGTRRTAYSFVDQAIFAGTMDANQAAQYMYDAAVAFLSE